MVVVSDKHLFFMRCKSQIGQLDSAVLAARNETVIKSGFFGGTIFSYGLIHMWLNNNYFLD